MKKEFKIAWEIQVEAADELSAAREALKIMQDPYSIAKQFYVQADGKEDVVSIDLDEAPGEEMLPVDHYLPIISQSRQKYFSSL